jgi:RNA polymerase sigma-70 factor (ECF subfamily)
MRLLPENKLKVKDDFTLIRAIQSGDHNAFETLINRYQRQVANQIYMNMGNRDDVDDIAQEVFIRVYRSLPKFKFHSSFFSWIYRITMNLCIDEIRKRKIRRMLSLDFLAEDYLDKNGVSDEVPTPSDSVLLNEKKDIVRRAMQHLSKEHREILTLREYQDLSYDEIAETLGLTVQAVKSRIFRARSEIRNLLGGYFKERV